MAELELIVQKERIKDFIVSNTIDRPSKDFTSYTFNAMRAAVCAQRLRQNTLGMGDVAATKKPEDDPFGYYCGMVESTLVQFANSMTYIGSMAALEGIVDDRDSLIKSAEQRLSRVLNTHMDTGIDTKGLSDQERIQKHIDLHYECLRGMTWLYNRGMEKPSIDPKLKEDFNNMLNYLRLEIEHANNVLGGGRSLNQSSGKNSCFIATAVYGNAYAPQVEALRNFRDNVLMQNRLGRKFIEIYYSGFGEHTADFIKDRMPYVLPVIKKGLDQIVRQYCK